MARKRKSAVKTQSIFITILLVIIFAAGFFYYSGLDLPAANTAAGSMEKLLPREGQLSVIIIDVGQGDSIFVQSPAGKTMLIDAGEHEAYEAIDSYLSAAGIKTIDVLVATHPHTDHIGGMAEVVQNRKIGAVYAPKALHTSTTYENLLSTIKAKGLKIKEAIGTKQAFLTFDEQLETTVLAPLSKDYKDLNNYSVVLRLAYGESEFILTGDAEKLSEKEMLEQLPASMLKADVLKIGHHGSNSSTSTKFLEAVDPQIALVSVGKGNRYDHPNEDIIAKLNKALVSVYRTDLHGIIAVFSDGNSIEIVTEK